MPETVKPAEKEHFKIGLSGWILAIPTTLLAALWFFIQLLQWKKHGDDFMLTVANIVVTVLLWVLVALVIIRYWRKAKWLPNRTSVNEIEKDNETDKLKTEVASLKDQLQAKERELAESKPVLAVQTTVESAPTPAQLEEECRVLAGDLAKLLIVHGHKIEDEKKERFSWADVDLAIQPDPIIEHEFKSQFLQRYLRVKTNLGFYGLMDEQIGPAIGRTRVREALKRDCNNANDLRRLYEHLLWISQMMKGCYGLAPLPAAPNSAVAQPIPHKPHLTMRSPKTVGPLPEVKADLALIAALIVNDEQRFETTAYKLRASLQFKHFNGDIRKTEGIWVTVPTDGSNRQCVESISLGMGKIGYLLLLFWDINSAPIKTFPVDGTLFPMTDPLRLGEWAVTVKVTGDNVELEKEIKVTLMPTGPMIEFRQD